MNATGGMVSTAPIIAPMTPKPRKSLRVIGSFCNSANFSPILEDPQAQLLLAKPGRRLCRFHRVIGLIIYREGHPRVGLHEAHVERHDRRQDPQGHEHHPVAPTWAPVLEAQPPAHIGDEGTEGGDRKSVV